MSNKKHFQISQQAVEKLAVRFGTPLLVLSLDEIKKNYKVLKKYMPRVKIHYAIKANPHPEILRVMADMGSCFDVASDGEIRTAVVKKLEELGVSGMAAMGQVIGAVKQQLGNAADGATVARIVKEELVK